MTLCRLEDKIPMSLRKTPSASSGLTMETCFFSEMLVSTNEYTQRYNPEEQDRHSGLDTDLGTDSEITVSYGTDRADED